MMENINFVKVTFYTNFETTYINGVPHNSSKTESYFLSEDEYNKVIDFINNLKEDEIIRKSLIAFFQSFPYDSMEKLGIKAKEAVNWLEKQGEKPQDKSALETIKGEKVDNQNCVKPADKVEPKFKVGDWIIRSAKGFKHSTYLVTEIKDYYICKTLKGRKVTFTFNDVHENFKLWDISDANDGDVLTWDDTTCVVLFKNIKNYKCFISYCFANNISFKIGTSHYIEGCHPATKEERDILFEKMHEAGYKWLEETKDLMKIEDICMYSTDNYTDEERKTLCEDCTESCKYNTNTWSEDDENRFKNLIMLINFSNENEPTKKGFIDFINKLKALKRKIRR